MSKLIHFTQATVCAEGVHGEGVRTNLLDKANCPVCLQEMKDRLEAEREKLSKRIAGLEHRILLGRGLR